MMNNIRMFWKINFEAINLLQKANSNKNLLQKADLIERSRKLQTKKTIKKLKPDIKMDKKL